MKKLVLGNSMLTITINEKGDIAEMYFPYVGLYQLVDKMYLGIWEKSYCMNWLKDPHWDVSQKYVDGSQVGITQAINGHGINLTIKDFVYPYLPIFCRDIFIECPESRTIKLYSYHDLHFTGLAIPDSAVYDEKIKSICHYELKNYILISSIPMFSEYACGRADFKGLRGTFVDAEDGTLSGCPASHGPVDSAIGIELQINPEEPSRVSLFFCAGNGFKEANRHRNVVYNKTVSKLYQETYSFWAKWLRRARDVTNADAVSDERLKKLFDVSALISALMCDLNTGSIIASPDADIITHGGDNYLYCWPRDAAFVVRGLDSISHFSLSRKFFEFCIKTISDGGYFLHRYCPDGSFGPTWHKHPFIQIDQTGSVLFALDNHLREFPDIEYLRNHKLWQMIKRSAEFLMKWRDEETGLPKPGYDLWEERAAILTYSSAAVYGGLIGAARIAQTLGKLDFMERWSRAAEEVKEGILHYLWNPKTKRFRRSIKPEDDTVDVSLFGVWFFDILPPHNERVRSTMKAIEDHLTTPKGGICRYAGDKYYGNENPWIICTLFLVEYYLWINETEKALKLFQWVADNALDTYLLPEQICSQTGKPLSVIPLTWSHAQYLIAFKQLAKQLAK